MATKRLVSRITLLGVAAFGLVGCRSSESEAAASAVPPSSAIASDALGGAVFAAPPAYITARLEADATIRHAGVREDVLAD